MVGFAFQIARAGDARGGAALLAHLAAGQPREVAAMLPRIIGWVASEASARRPSDPAQGAPFAEADPATVPWEGHMLLSRQLCRRLDSLDARLAEQRMSSGNAAVPQMQTRGAGTGE
jgi:hypothetical protein